MNADPLMPIAVTNECNKDRLLAQAVDPILANSITILALNWVKINSWPKVLNCFIALVISFAKMRNVLVYHVEPFALYE